MDPFGKKAITSRWITARLLNSLQLTNLVNKALQIRQPKKTIGKKYNGSLTRYLYALFQC
jgi:hypothetical protein